MRWEKDAGLFHKAKCFVLHLLTLGIHATQQCFSVKHSQPTVDSSRNNSYMSWNHWVAAVRPRA